MFDKIFLYLFKNRLTFLLTALVLLIISLSLEFSIDQGFFILKVINSPFELIANLLRTIASSSEFGNLIGLLLLIIISFTPLILILINKKSKSIFKISFYIILSLLIGITLYIFINPSLIPNPIQNLGNYLNQDEIKGNIPKSFLEQYNLIFKTGIVMIIVSFILIYLAIKFYLQTKKHKISLVTGAKGLLTLIKISYLITFILTFFLLPLMIKSNINQIPFNDFDSSIVRNLLILKYLFIYLILIVSFFIYHKLYGVLINFTKEIIFTENNIVLLHQTALYFIIILLVSISYQLINNLYQIINSNKLQNMSLNLNLPTTQLILALAFYLLSIYMKQAYIVYKENQLTI